MVLIETVTILTSDIWYDCYIMTDIINDTTTIVINNVSKNYVTSTFWGTGSTTVGCLRIDSYFQKKFYRPNFNTSVKLHVGIILCCIYFSSMV